MGKLNLFQIGYKHKGENNMKVWLVDKTNLSPLNKQFSRNDLYINREDISTQRLAREGLVSG